MPATPRLKVTALHGFFGLPAAWDFLRDAGFEVRAPDLYRLLAAEPEPSLASLGRAVGRQPRDFRLLIGYSLGGRVALHALLEEPGRWDAAVIVSAHSGLEDEGARLERVASDHAWARRIETARWDEVVAAWMAQPVFRGRPGPERREQDFSRARLALAMRALSLGLQAPLADRIAAMRIPILWVAGEEDARYARIARELHARGNPASRLWIAPGAAHRVPWETPAAFAGACAQFLRSPIAEPARAAMSAR